MAPHEPLQDFVALPLEALPTLMDESRLFPQLAASPPMMAPCTPPLVSRVSSSAGRLSSTGGSGGRASGAEPTSEPRVRRSSSLPEHGGSAPADAPDDGLLDQAERLLSRPRPPGHNRRAGGARPSCASQLTTPGGTPTCTPEAPAVSAYVADDEYF